MNKKELKHIVDCNVKKMIKKLGLGEWQIKFRYKMSDEHKNCRGYCSIHSQSKQATITLNPRLLTIKREVISTLRHELVHLIVNIFSEYRHVIHTFIGTSSSPATSRELAVLNEAFNLAKEKITYDICRALERKR